MKIFLLKTWKWILAFVAIFLGFKVISANKSVSKITNKLNKEMEAAESKIKEKRKSIEKIQKEAEQNVKKTEKKNEKFNEKQKKLKTESDIKESQDLDGVWGWLMIMSLSASLVSCAAPQIKVMDIQKETAVNELLRKEISPLPLPEVSKDKSASIIIKHEGIDYVAYDIENHGIVKAKLNEGKRYKEYADESIYQLGLANRKINDIVDALNTRTYQTYTLQNSFNECAGALYREKIFGGFYQLLAIGAAGVAVVK